MKGGLIVLGTRYVEKNFYIHHCSKTLQLEMETKHLKELSFTRDYSTKKIVLHFSVPVAHDLVHQY